MIQHLVVFNLKPEVTTADRDWLFNQIRAVLGRIPTVRNLRLARAYSARDAAGKPKRPVEFEWALSVDFEDEAGLEIYSRDPDHRALAPEIQNRTSSLKIMDFES